MQRLALSASIDLRRSCNDGGYLVPQSSWLPDDDFDHQFLRWGPRVGCNRLACARCGARVKSAAGAGGGRLYACLCHRLPVDAERPAGSGGGVWRCHGHPPLELPAVVDGVLVRKGENLGAVARAFFLGALLVASHPSLASVEAFWLHRLYAAVPDDAKILFAAGVSQLLLDEDERVRAGALRFFCRID